MSVFEIIAVLTSLAAALAFINFKVLKLPTTIGLMALSLASALGLLGLGLVVPTVHGGVERFMGRIDFSQTLLRGMLGFLLFAGALHVDLSDLKAQKFAVGLLASLGVVVTAALVGGAVYILLPLIGLGIPLIYCLLFGAVVAPTDPIAVLGVMTNVGAPKPLETKITGESLFNDGVGVVVFLGLLTYAGLDPHSGGAAAHADTTFEQIAWLFIEEALGGGVFGLAIGLLAYWMLQGIDEYKTEILISLGIVTGGYALANHLEISGPIAMVVAGLLIGNQGRASAMSNTTREHLDTFWELVDEVLNAVLFVLVGLEVLIISATWGYVLAGLAAVAITLAVRTITVGSIVWTLGWGRSFEKHTTLVMVWGGLRGGISVALALSLNQVIKTQHPDDQSLAASQLILTMTYVVVVFSILVQGLTVSPLLRKLNLAS